LVKAGTMIFTHIPQVAHNDLTRYELDVNRYKISALRMLGPEWNVKVKRLNPDEARTTEVPQRLPV